MKQYFFKIATTYTDKNKLYKELREYVQTLDGTLITGQEGLDNFRYELGKKQAHLNREHFRCNPIEIKYGDHRISDNYSVYVSGSWHAQIYEVKHTFQPTINADYMDSKNLRYIVLMLNPDTAQYLSGGTRINTHEGEIWCSLKDAKESAMDAIKNKLCTRFAIGCFVMDPNAERIYIDLVETYGFRNDKKKVNQLDFFK